jgi:hypothetical protein
MFYLVELNSKKTYFCHIIYYFFYKKKEKKSLLSNHQADKVMQHLETKENQN